MTSAGTSPAAETGAAGVRVSLRPLAPAEARRDRRRPIPPPLRNLPGTLA